MYREKYMSDKVGLWIDHQKAIIIFIRKKIIAKKTIKSEVEPHVRLSGGSHSSKPYGSQDIESETRRNAKYKLHLDIYYQRVVDDIRKIEDIFIFGPGGAKIELKKHLEKSKDLGMQVRGVEPADKMTERQIVAKVKDFFSFSNYNHHLLGEKRKVDFL
jgi:hypothetical protein